jgi:hypothetical protein
MLLAAIYNVFDGEEHLERSVNYLPKDIELIFVYQTVSNFGEQRKIEVYKELETKIGGRWVHYEPKIYRSKDSGTINERNKREIGLGLARELGCTHFLFMDCDEMYPKFNELMEEYKTKGKDGSVCLIDQYLLNDKYRLTPKLDWFVPFIHKITRETTITKSYPYPVDQTRSVNTKDVAVLSHSMQHLTWVRDNIHMKIRNSSAQGRRNDRILNDLKRLECGNISQFRSEYYYGRGVEYTNELNK